jgi:hypothetical protein
MSYDDSALAMARGTAGLFKCLMCGRRMRNAGERWECFCGFFYKPLVPGTIPRKYLQGETKTAKKMCRECGKVEIRGIRKFCGPCATRRKRSSNRKHWHKRVSLGKTGFSPIAAEALTNAL